MRFLIGLAAIWALDAAAEPPHPGEAAYRKVCFACHDKGADNTSSAGAPRISNVAAWDVLRKKGADALAVSVISPKPGRIAMPRADLTDDEIRAAVAYMLERSNPRTMLESMGERRGMPVLD